MAEEQQDVSTLPLIGTEDATMDDKGRVLVGTKLRKRLGPNFTMCLGENGSINVYRAKTWSGMVQDTLNRDPRLQSRQDYARFLMGSAEDDLDFDTQGRVVIPKKLREKAEIVDKVKIIGCGDCIEIWSKDNFDRYMQDGRGADPNRQERMRDSYQSMIGSQKFNASTSADV